MHDWTYLRASSKRLAGVKLSEQMGRLFVALLLCSSLSIGLYIYLQQVTRGSTQANSVSAPKRTLDNVHRKAKSIEEDAQKRMDETMRKTE